MFETAEGLFVVEMLKPAVGGTKVHGGAMVEVVQTGLAPAVSHAKGHLSQCTSQICVFIMEVLALEKSRHIS